MGIKYYTNLERHYIGAFTENNPNLPMHAIEVTNPPPDNLLMLWDGDTWVEPILLLTTHAGRYFVAAAQTYVIPKNLLSICKARLDLEGDLQIDGQLFMET